MPGTKRLKIESPAPARGANEVTTSSRWGSALGTKTAPFWLDDDSGSDCEVTKGHVPCANQSRSSAGPPRANGRARLDEEAKAAARAQSKLLRQAALDRKDVKVEQDEVHSEQTIVEIDQPPLNTETKILKRTPPQPQNAPNSSQVHQRQCPPEPETDHTLKPSKDTDQLKGTDIRAQQRSSMRDNSNGSDRSMSTKSVRFAVQGYSAGGKPNGIGGHTVHEAVTSHTPLQIKTHPPTTHQPTENTSAALRPGFSIDAPSLQSPESCSALSNTNIDERHEHRTPTERGMKNPANQKPQSARSSAALVQSASGPSQAALTTKHERQGAEDSPRRTVDDQRDAEWHQREQAKKVLEKRRYDLVKKQEESNREAAKQRQIRVEAEQRSSYAQTSALSTLEAANRAALEKKRQQDRHGAVRRTGMEIPPTPPASKEPSEDREYGAVLLQPTTSSNKKECESTGTHDLFSAQRLNRIQAKESQNERVRKAEAEATEEEDRQSRIEESEAKLPTTQQDRPCSLRRAAELGRLTTSVQQQAPASEAKVRFPARHFSSEEEANTYLRLKRDLGFIRPEDAQLLEWMENGRFARSDIVLLYEKATGIRLLEKSVQKRYYLVKRLLQLGGVGDRFRLLAAQEDRQTIRKMCTAINSTSSATILHNTLSGPNSLKIGSDARSPLLPMAAKPCLANSVDDRPPSSLSSDAAIVPDLEAETRESSCASSDGLQRPTQGGKTLNLEAMQYFCEQYWEDTDKEGTAARDDSPAREEDRCHFLFQVQHRHLTTEDLDSGELDTKQWDPYDHVYESLTEAYLKLDLELKRYEKRFERRGDKDWVLRRCLTDNDLKMFSIQSTVAGRAELKVIQFLPPPEETKLPKSKEGWLSTTVFFVIEETIKNTIVEDNLLDASEKVETREPVANEIYTARELANRRAAERFVKLTFTPASLHLDTRKAQVQQAERELLDEIDDEEGELFHHTATTEDKAVKVSKSVWVEEGTLRGPRNL